MRVIEISHPTVRSAPGARSIVNRWPDGGRATWWFVRVLVDRGALRLHEVAIPRAAREPDLCPVRNLHEYTTVLAARGLTSGPLFRRITRTDAILPNRSSAQTVRLVVDKLANGAGIPVPEGYAAYAAHSLRRGMATESRRAGHDALTIARAGGWTDGSTALARYLTDVDAWERNALDGVI